MSDKSKKSKEDSLRGKFAKLISDYTKLKQKVSILKKGVLEEKKKTEELELERQEKNAQIRKLENDIDTLSFNNESMTRRCRKLMSQCRQLMKERKSRGSGWMGSIILGNQKSPDVEKLEQVLQVTQQELLLKIKENEQVHMEMFTLRSEQTKTLETLQAKLDELKRLLLDKEDELNDLEASYQELNDNNEDLQQSTSETIADLRRQLLATQNEMAEAEETMAAVNEQVAAQLKELQDRYSSKITFDDTKIESFSNLNLPSFDRAFVLTKIGFAEECLMIVDKIGEHMVGVAKLMIEKISLAVASRRGASSWSHTPGEPAVSIEILTSSNNSDTNDESASTVRALMSISSEIRTVFNEFAEHIRAVCRTLSEQAHYRVEDNVMSDDSDGDMPYTASGPRSLRHSSVHDHRSNRVLAEELQRQVFCMESSQEPFQSPTNPNNSANTPSEQAGLTVEAISSVLEVVTKFLSVLLDALNDHNRTGSLWGGVRLDKVMRSHIAYLIEAYRAFQGKLFQGINSLADLRHDNPTLRHPLSPPVSWPLDYLLIMADTLSPSKQQSSNSREMKRKYQSDLLSSPLDDINQHGPSSSSSSPSSSSSSFGGQSTDPSSSSENPACDYLLKMQKLLTAIASKYATKATYEIKARFGSTIVRKTNSNIVSGFGTMSKLLVKLAHTLNRYRDIHHSSPFYHKPLPLPPSKRSSASLPYSTGPSSQASDRHDHSSMYGNGSNSVFYSGSTRHHGLNDDNHDTDTYDPYRSSHTNSHHDKNITARGGEVEIDLMNLYGRGQTFLSRLHALPKHEEGVPYRKALQLRQRMKRAEEMAKKAQERQVALEAQVEEITAQLERKGESLRKAQDLVRNQGKKEDELIDQYTNLKIEHAQLQKKYYQMEDRIHRAEELEGRFKHTLERENHLRQESSIEIARQQAEIDNLKTELIVLRRRMGMDIGFQENSNQISTNEGGHLDQNEGSSNSVSHLMPDGEHGDGASGEGVGTEGKGVDWEGNSQAMETEAAVGVFSVVSVTEMTGETNNYDGYQMNTDGVMVLVETHDQDPGVRGEGEQQEDAESQVANAQDDAGATDGSTGADVGSEPAVDEENVASSSSPNAFKPKHVSVNIMSTLEPDLSADDLTKTPDALTPVISDMKEMTGEMNLSVLTSQASNLDADGAAWSSDNTQLGQPSKSVPVSPGESNDIEDERRRRREHRRRLRFSARAGHADENDSTSGNLVTSLDASANNNHTRSWQEANNLIDKEPDFGTLDYSSSSLAHNTKTNRSGATSAASDRTLLHKQPVSSSDKGSSAHLYSSNNSLRSLGHNNTRTDVDTSLLSASYSSRLWDDRGRSSLFDFDDTIPTRSKEKLSQQSLFISHLTTLHQADAAKEATQLRAELEKADTKAAEFHFQLKKMARALTTLYQQSQSAIKEKEICKKQMVRMKEELSTTKDGYETMLREMTERLCQLTEEVAKKDARGGGFFG